MDTMHKAYVKEFKKCLEKEYGTLTVRNSNCSKNIIIRNHMDGFVAAFCLEGISNAF